MRKRLYEATLSAARYNPAVKHLYRRLKDAGKPGKVARIAAAQKLLLIAHAVHKSNEQFRVSEEVQTWLSIQQMTPGTLVSGGHKQRYSFGLGMLPVRCSAITICVTSITDRGAKVVYWGQLLPF